MPRVAGADQTQRQAVKKERKLYLFYYREISARRAQILPDRL